MKDIIIVLNALYELTQREEILHLKSLVISCDEAKSLPILQSCAELLYDDNNLSCNFDCMDRFKSRGSLDETYLQIFLGFLHDDHSKIVFNVNELRDFMNLSLKREASSKLFFKEISYEILKNLPTSNRFFLLREGMLGLNKNPSKALSDIVKFFTFENKSESLETLRKAFLHLDNTFDFLNYALKYFYLSSELPLFQKMRKVLKTTELPILVSALSHGQIQSKKWLLDEWQKLQDEPVDIAFVLGGWIGVLPLMHFESSYNLTKKFRNFDIDPKAIEASENLCRHLVQEDWKYKGIVQDMYTLNYELTDYKTKKSDGSFEKMTERADIVINTSCEHIESFDSWLSQIPFGTRLILQSNNYFAEPSHVNCVPSLQAFKEQVPLSNLQFSGTLDLGNYQRFMLIGVR